jgi:hypothetical protein
MTPQEHRYKWVRRVKCQLPSDGDIGRLSLRANLDSFAEWTADEALAEPERPARDAQVSPCPLPSSDLSCPRDRAYLTLTSLPRRPCLRRPSPESRRMDWGRVRPRWQGIRSQLRTPGVTIGDRQAAKQKSTCAPRTTAYAAPDQAAGSEAGTLPLQRDRTRSGALRGIFRAPATSVETLRPSRDRFEAP